MNEPMKLTPAQMAVLLGGAIATIVLFVIAPYVVVWEFEGYAAAKTIAVLKANLADPDRIGRIVDWSKWWFYSFEAKKPMAWFMAGAVSGTAVATFVGVIIRKP